MKEKWLVFMTGKDHLSMHTLSGVFSGLKLKSFVFSPLQANVEGNCGKLAALQQRVQRSRRKLFLDLKYVANFSSGRTSSSVSWPCRTREERHLTNPGKQCDADCLFSR